MKLMIALSLLTLSFVSMASSDLAQKLVGKYAAVDANCAYEQANIKLSRSSDVRVLNITLSTPRLGSFNNQAIDLDNMWTKVRTTRGYQRIIKQDRIQGSTILSEEKKCMPGWVSCDEWTVKASITLLNDDTMEAQLSPEEAACIYKKIK